MKLGKSTSYFLAAGAILISFSAKSMAKNVLQKNSITDSLSISVISSKLDNNFNNKVSGKINTNTNTINITSDNDSIYDDDFVNFIPNSSPKNSNNITMLKPLIMLCLLTVLPFISSFILLSLGALYNQEIMKKKNKN